MLFRKMLRCLEVDSEADANYWLDNDDLRLVPLEKRNWGVWTYSYFWLSAAATVSNWYSPSLFMMQGLSMWEAAACHLGGQFLAGVTMVFTGKPGAVYSIGYPVLARASFGLFGSIWPVLNRVFMSIIWNGINLVQTGQCIHVILHCMFPSIEHLNNVMSPEDAINSGGLIGLMIAWLIVFACCFVPITKLKYLVFIKIAVFVISSVAMLTWCSTIAGGVKDINHRPLTMSKSWLRARFTFLSWGNCSTFIVNASDFQRYARKPRDVIFGQAVGFPVGNFIVSMMGLLVASTSETIFGSIIWNPLLYLDKLVSSHYTPAYRAGCFFWL